MRSMKLLRICVAKGGPPQVASRRHFMKMKNDRPSTCRLTMRSKRLEFFPLFPVLYLSGNHPHINMDSGAEACFIQIHRRFV